MAVWEVGEFLGVVGAVRLVLLVFAAKVFAVLRVCWGGLLLFFCVFFVGAKVSWVISVSKVV